jgi:hypothetical protein
MKTAMHEWIYWLNAYSYELPLELQIKANELIELEKKQIVDAWDDGNTEAKFDDGIACNSIDYYSIKHNNCK